MTHARHQQYRHLARSAGYALSAGLILLIAGSATRSGHDARMVPALVLLGAALGRAARCSHRFADRWRVGADSEQTVQYALKRLARSGWMVRNGVRWPGGGDIDHLVQSPDGVGFAIETKTRTFSEEHLRRTAATARWAAGRRRRYPCGVVPVLCVVRARRLESRYGDVRVVSLDRLLVVLERLAHTEAARSGGRREDGGEIRRVQALGLTPLRAGEPERWLTKR